VVDLNHIRSPKHDLQFQGFLLSAATQSKPTFGSISVLPGGCVHPFPRYLCALSGRLQGAKRPEGAE
jgi:hypothetical protein